MISHSHKFIFIWIPKTGGSSIERVLYEYGLQKYGPSGKRNRRVFRPVRQRKVKKLRRIREFREHWDGYFKFTFVRNPWDWLVSRYHSSRRRRLRYWAGKDEPFRRFVLDGGWRNRSFQQSFYDSIEFNGKIDVDFVGRTETIEADFAHICSKIGITAKLPHVNRNLARAADYKSYYDDNLKGAVASIFSKDIKTFGFKW